MCGGAVHYLNRVCLVHTGSGLLVAVPDALSLVLVCSRERRSGVPGLTEHFAMTENRHDKSETR